MTSNLDESLLSAIRDEVWSDAEPSPESEILQLKEAASHLAGLSGNGCSIDKHGASKTLLSWAIAAGGRVKAWPVEGGARPFWTVEIKIHGVEVSLYSWEEL